MPVASLGTFWLVLDVRRGSRHAPGPGHDVTGPDLDLNFPDTHSGCDAGLRMTDVASLGRPGSRTSGASPAAPLSPGINLNFPWPDAHFGSAIDCP